ncbi:MAG: TlpA family protein disulfide reductase [Planctomycetota bacterium]
MQPRHVLSISMTLITGTLLSGCGGTSNPEPAAASAAAPASQPDSPGSQSSVSPVIRPAGLTASIPQVTDRSDAAGSSEPTSGTPQPEFPDDEATQSLTEIRRLRTAAFPADVDAARKARRERNERIIDLATRAIRGTMSDASRSVQFDSAIRQLLEARFQIALTGSEEDIESLYSDVQALCDRDPKSPAAAEGVYTIARFAHTKAGLIGRTQPVWFETLSRWAREFADRFPDDQKRSTSLLFGAARSCELHATASTDAELSSRLLTESRLCYTALAEKFGTTDQGQEATASLRRLALPGQMLTQFSGPTSDGGYVTAEDFKDKPTLIYFWDSQSDDFRETVLPALTRIREQLPPERLRIIGVALDEDESELNAFLEQHHAPGQQIFFPQTAQRSWNSPLVRFWGLAASPSIWVLNSDARVLSTSVSVEQLVPTLQQALRKSPVPAAAP